MSILATLVVLLFIGGRLFLLAHPRDNEEMRESVYLRNSLIAKVGKMQDFVWSPKDIPNEYLSETLDVPEYFKSISERILGKATAEATNFDKALLIARHLSSGGGQGGAIRSNTRDAYERIITKGQGVCSDFTQVFNALAIASGIPVREWGMFGHDFGDHGDFFHSVNEIYEPSLRKWVLVDSYLSFFVRDSKSGTPLSVMQFRDYLLGHSNGNFTIVPIVEGKLNLRSFKAERIDYYRRGIDMLYLLGGNNVFSLDANPLVQKMASLSRGLELATAIIVGVHPKIWIVPTESNQQQIQHLFAMRRNFLMIVVIGSVLSVALVLQIYLYTRIARSRKTRRAIY